jgi:hypothetical protein
MPATYSLTRDPGRPVDVSGTPWMFGSIYFWGSSVELPATGLSLAIVGRAVEVSQAGTVVATADLSPLIEANNGSRLSRSTVDFVVGERRYAIVVNTLSLTGPANGAESEVHVENIEGTLFSSQPAD